MMRYSLLLLLICSACMYGSHAMSAGAFYDVPLGATSEELREMVGRPYSIRTNKNGDEVYEYIEKVGPILYHVSGGQSTSTVTKYSFILRDGKVIDKKIRTETPPAFRGDSYDLETTSVDIEPKTEITE